MTTLSSQRDDFVKMSMMKLPAFYEYLDIEDANGCPKWHLNNYPCLAYVSICGLLVRKQFRWKNC